MATYPISPRAAFMEWCQAHQPVFTAHSAEIGLTPEQAAAFKDATDAAAGAILAQQQARQAAEAATQAAEHAAAALRASAGDTVRLVRIFAQSSDTPDLVYRTAQIPVPAAPSPAPPPARPSQPTVTLDAATGSLTLRWKASNPVNTSGTSYIVRRRLPGQSEFAFLGVTGTKEFLDDTLPAGAASVQYTVQGQRAHSSGPLSPILTVSLGHSAAGARTASVAAPAAAGEASLVNAILTTKPLANGHTPRERARV